MLESLHLGSWARFITGQRLAPFVKTPADAREAMLRLAALSPDEALVDLGAGDGAMLRTAVERFGAASAVGYELDAELVRKARLASADEPRIECRHAAAEEAEKALRAADVVTLYLSERGNATLLPLLARSLRPESRIVSFVWEMPFPSLRTVSLAGSGAPIRLFTGRCCHDYLRDRGRVH